MSDFESARTRLKSVSRECQLHLDRLNHARQKLAGRFPLSVEDWQNLDNDTISHLDQLLFRFGRLQDTIGQRLFRHLLELSLEWDDSEPFIDKLSRLERLSIIPSAEQWLILRELRNSAMHEYPDQPELTVANLNRIHDAAEPLARIFHAADRFAAGLLGNTN